MGSQSSVHWATGLNWMGFRAVLVCSVLSCPVMSDSLRPHGVQPARLLCPWGFYRQEYQSGLPCPPPGNLPNPGIELRSPSLQADSLSSEPLGNITAQMKSGGKKENPNHKNICFFPSFLRYNWHITLYTICWFDPFKHCKMITSIAWANTSITSTSSPFIFCGEKI